jgi:hypothetical protein
MRVPNARTDPSATTSGASIQRTGTDRKLLNYSSGSGRIGLGLSVTGKSPPTIVEPAPVVATQVTGCPIWDG